MLPATFKFLQPHSALAQPAKYVLASWAGGLASRLDLFGLDGSQMAGNNQMYVRQLYRSLLGARQMAGTQPNCWDSAKWLGLSQMARVAPQSQIHIGGLKKYNFHVVLV